MTYTLPKCTLPWKSPRVLAFDPGSRNMGIAVVSIVKNPVRLVIAANGVMTSPVHDLIDYRQAREAFLSETDQWVTAFNPTNIIAERFQTRGHNGVLIEYVGAMLGLLGGAYSYLPMYLTIASTWKNAFNKRWGDGALEWMYANTTATPHQLDACLIGIACYERHMATRALVRYELEDILDQVENTSVTPLKKPRNQ